MKSILVFACCLGLAIGTVFAEPKKEGKGKRAGGGQGGQQAQHVHQGHGQGGGGGGRRAAFNGPGAAGGGGTHLNKGAHLNAGHGNKGLHHNQQGVSGTGQGNLPAGQHPNRTGAGKAQVKHFEFNNNRNANIKSVTFKENRRIIGAENWRGQRYVVFRNYRPAWHDRLWWTGHYPRVVLIGGGWYYWNSGFWYPAWGYESAQAYYPYDGPIYAYNDLPPDQVVANVQEELQNQGYYHGEADGLLGPLTRAALADYQRDHGLYTTAAIDEPTMASLGFGGAEQEQEQG